MKDANLDTSGATRDRSETSGVDVVIVSYRTPDLVLGCVASVEGARPRSITVVDNASGDDTVDALRSNHHDVRVIANSHNVGYGAGANQGVAAGEAPLVLILNGDTTIEPDALRAIEQHFQQNPRAGIVGPTIRRTDGSLQHSTYRFPSLTDTLVGETGLQLLVARSPLLRERFLRTWSHDHVRRVDWVVGAALAIRRSAFEQIGGFDERFFMYSEEVDLCHRMADAGHHVEFAPLTVVTHVGEASAKQSSEAMERERQRSAVRYLQIHSTKGRATAILRLQRSITLLRAVRDVMFSLRSGAGRRRHRRREAAARWRLVRETELWRT